MGTESVRVAVVDSGLNPRHPHLGRVAPGVCLPEGSCDTLDRIGHGTAVGAVVAWWAPQVELIPVRIFHDELRCPATWAQEGLAWALEAQADLVLLSLACGSSEGWPELVARALSRGVGLVAAARNGYPEDGGTPGYPAGLPGVLGVRCRADRQRRFEYTPGNPVQLIGPRLPRPLPGRPALRNLQGNSLAAAHACGVLACGRRPWSPAPTLAVGAGSGGLAPTRGPGSTGSARSTRPS